MAQCALGQVLAEKSDDASPWSQLPVGYRLNHMAPRTLTFELPSEADQDEAPVAQVTVTSSACGYQVSVNNEGKTAQFDNVQANVTSQSESALSLEVEMNSVLRQGTMVEEGDAVHLFTNGQHITLTRDNPHARHGVTDAGHSGSGTVVAPMPCKIAQVMIKPGAEVTKGTVLVVLEAMKMEHVIRAPKDGKVERIAFEAGALVEEGKPIVFFAAEDKKEKE